MAIGQKTNLKFITEADGIKLTPRGLSRRPGNQGHLREGVFAGGDVETGPWIAIAAVAAGREAATSVDRFLSGQDLKAGREIRSGPSPRKKAIGTRPGGYPEETTGPHVHHAGGRVDQGF